MSTPESENFAWPRWESNPRPLDFRFPGVYFLREHHQRTSSPEYITPQNVLKVFLKLFPDENSANLTALLTIV